MSVLSPSLNSPLLSIDKIVNLLLLLAGLTLVYVAFADGLSWNVRRWASEEYSHSYLIPVIAAYLIWQDRERLEQLPFGGSWAGLALFVVGLCVLVIGELATLYPVMGYGFIICILGIVWAWAGTAVFRKVLPALALLFFTIPLPSFLFNNLSSYLQLISSQIGVAVIRLFDISVYIEGNVIDLGSMKLQVVEACSGLRYLFPLMTLAFMMAMFFKAPMWKRALLFLSSIPITILMNSFRIGVIGVLVEYYGKSMAEGFLHDFEGWVVFMAALGVLFLEMLLLSKIWVSKTPVAASANATPRMPPAALHAAPRRSMAFPLYLGLLLVIPVALLSGFVADREEEPQARNVFADFPMQLGDWAGKRDLMDQLYIDELDFDDYLLADYRQSGSSAAVNLYIAWYDQQRKGESAHSPRTCLPGGGWRIVEFDQYTNEAVSLGDGPIRFNRSLIRKGDSEQLVYYWFHQRNRTLTNEYLVKWFLFWDALTKNRTDGALIRYTSVVNKGESLADADRRLASFVTASVPDLENYLGR